MKAEVTAIKSKRRYVAICLGLFLFSIYLLFYRGGFHSIDEVSMFAVTESLVKFGRVNTDQIAWTQWTTIQAEAQGFFGTDGHVYSKKGLALSLAQAPLYWLALSLPGLGMLQTVSLVNAFITAATGLLVFMFVHRLNFSTFTAIMAGLIFGLVTIVAVYAKYLFSEPLAGFLLLLTAYMLFAYKQEGGRRHLVIAGLAAGLAVLTRANNLFLLPIFGLYLLWIEYKRFGESTDFAIRPFAHSLLVFGAALAIPGAILLTYNALRAGNPFQTGYDLTLFSPNVVLGLYKLLFSPLRGLFIYSPILLLSLPGWWALRRIYPAEAWLFVGLIGVTVGLFSAWSSGEGLSWGSRFLVPVVPFFVMSLTPIVEQVAGSKVTSSKVAETQRGRGAGRETHVSHNTQHATRNTQYVPRPTSHVPRSTPYLLHIPFLILLVASFLIQLLGVIINPWVFLARLQAEFGGEFFLEKTAALYDFRYSQLAGQLQSWSVENSDLVWWQPWGFDGLAFGLSLGLVLLTGWLLWWQVSGFGFRVSGLTHHAPRITPHVSRLTSHSSLLTLLLTLAITYFLLTRYNQTDRQFGPPDDAYTQTLNTIAAQTSTAEPVITAAQNHYHVPMNRFKARIPLIGFAQQVAPLPDTALPLLATATAHSNIWLVTVGFPPAAPNNAAERWLALNTFKVSDEWFPNEVRRARFTSTQPTTTRPLETTFGHEVELVSVKLLETRQPGDPLPVAFTWYSLGQPQANYNIFLQLLDVNGKLVTQHDSPPNGGYTPTTHWQKDQQIVSRHALILPANLPPGKYRLIAGLHNPQTGRRLPLASGSDFVELGNITIIEEVAAKARR